MIQTSIDEIELKVFNGLIPKNGVFFDIGARMNFESYWNLRNDVNYHLFEPNPTYFTHLVESVSKVSDGSNITANNIALSNFISDGVPYYGDGSDSILNLGRGSELVCNVPVTTLEHYTTTNKITHIDFIKIDTEGSDYGILEGSYDTIKKMQVPYIQFEYWDKLKQFELLLANEYDMYILNESTLASYTNMYDSIIPMDSVLSDTVTNQWITRGWGANVLAVNKNTKFDYTKFLYTL
jgi:FkbM family methyltransferase